MNFTKIAFIIFTLATIQSAVFFSMVGMQHGQKQHTCPIFAFMGTECMGNATDASIFSSHISTIKNVTRAVFGNDVILALMILLVVAFTIIISHSEYGTDGSLYLSPQRHRWRFAIIIAQLRRKLFLWIALHNKRTIAPA